MARRIVPTVQPRIPYALLKGTMPASARALRQAGSALNFAVGQSQIGMPWSRVGADLVSGSVYLMRIIRRQSWSVGHSALLLDMVGEGTYDVTFPNTTPVAGFTRRLQAQSADELGAMQLAGYWARSGGGSSESRDLTIEPHANMTLRGISDVAFPRREMPEQGRGVAVDQFRPGELIHNFAFDTQSESWRRLVIEGNNFTSCTMRHPFHWCVPHTVDSTVSTAFAKQTDSETFVDIFGEKIPMLTWRRGPTDALGAVDIRFFAWVESGGGGQIRFTFDSGATSTLNVTATTPTAGVSANRNCRAEDMAEDDGIPTAGIDFLRCEFRTTVTAKSVYVSTIAVSNVQN